MTFLIRLLAISAIVIIMKSYSNTFWCGYFAFMLVELVMFTTKPAPVEEEK